MSIPQMITAFTQAICKCAFNWWKSGLSVSASCSPELARQGVSCLELMFDESHRTMVFTSLTNIIQDSIKPHVANVSGEQQKLGNNETTALASDTVFNLPLTCLCFHWTHKNHKLQTKTWCPAVVWILKERKVKSNFNEPVMGRLDDLMCETVVYCLCLQQHQL